MLLECQGDCGDLTALSVIMGETLRLPHNRQNKPSLLQRQGEKSQREQSHESTTELHKKCV